GGYRLVLATAEGAPLSGEETSLPIRILPDLAPTVTIPVPSGDTVAPAAGSLPLVVDVQDDHGLVDVVLERRPSHGRSTRPHGGTTRQLADAPLPFPGQARDRAILPAAVDPAALGLVAGDTLRITARARDNSPSHQVGRSHEISISVPTRPELRAEEKERVA